MVFQSPAFEDVSSRQLLATRHVQLAVLLGSYQEAKKAAEWGNLLDGLPFGLCKPEKLCKKPRTYAAPEDTAPLCPRFASGRRFEASTQS